MENKKTGISWRDILPYIVLIVVVVLVRVFILVNAYIPTQSMENTIPAETRVMGLKCAYWFSEPQRGDIIVFYAPDLENTLYVKRLIGLPGDTVEVREGVVYVNGQVLQEDYLKEEMRAEDFGPYEVPEDCYFFMGDNRNDSLDARYWENTYVSRDRIVGKVYFSYWPFPPKWIASTPDYGIDEQD